MKCFYHSADLDGKCSGAIVKMAYPECELIGINYGDPVPWERLELGETVYMVDFCLQPFSDMNRLDDMCHLIWIDHHKTSLEEMQKKQFPFHGYHKLEIGRAGCELTWETIMDSPLPPAVFLLGRYDVWDHAHADVVEFQYGMRFYDADPNNTKFWRSLFESSVTSIVNLGSDLLTYERQQNDMYVRAYAFLTEIDGLRCIAVNKGLTNSLLFKSVYDPEQHDVMASFVRRKDGQWKMSLYTDKPDIDVSVICKARGGGGHKGASGFQCAVLPF